MRPRPTVPASTGLAEAELERFPSPPRGAQCEARAPQLGRDKRAPRARLTMVPSLKPRGIEGALASFTSEWLGMISGRKRHSGVLRWAIGKSGASSIDGESFAGLAYRNGPRRRPAWTSCWSPMRRRRGMARDGIALARVAWGGTHGRHAQHRATAGGIYEASRRFRLTRSRAVGSSLPLHAMQRRLATRTIDREFLTRRWEDFGLRRPGRCAEGGVPRLEI